MMKKMIAKYIKMADESEPQGSALKYKTWINDFNVNYSENNCKEKELEWICIIHHFDWYSFLWGQSFIFGTEQEWQNYTTIL
jgi:hypothetical protein